MNPFFKTITILGALIFASLTLDATPASAAKSIGSWYAKQQISAPGKAHAIICHGYECRYKKKVAFTGKDLAKFASFFEQDTMTAEQERAAIGDAVKWYEKIVEAKVEIADDVARSPISLSGDRGQLDCIDETTNTMSFLIIISRLGLLKHHNVIYPISRGFFLDFRYPHFSAMISERGSQKIWSVDSWPNKNAERPQMLPLAKWKKL